MNEKRLDAKGRCCGRRPLFYKRSTNIYVLRTSVLLYSLRCGFFTRRAADS
jgi:hypothetical protein